MVRCGKDLLMVPLHVRGRLVYKAEIAVCMHAETPHLMHV